MEETAGVVKLIAGGYYCGMTAFEVSAMNQIPLADLVAEKGQTHVARAFGVSPPAISKALSAERSFSSRSTITVLTKRKNYGLSRRRPAKMRWPDE